MPGEEKTKNNRQALQAVEQKYTCNQKFQSNNLSIFWRGGSYGN
jgi:hypothetical protein